jgi:Flp pilus assembly protein TadG
MSFVATNSDSTMTKHNKSRKSGNALVEFALISPWFFLLFTGVMNAGFATYGLIAVQNAARVAALHDAGNVSSASDQSGACALVIQQLKGLPNVGSSFSSSCNADPVTVTVNYCDGTTPCTGSTNSADNGPAAFVSVTYRLPQLFQLPIGGLSTITRTAEMRLRDPLP